MTDDAHIEFVFQGETWATDYRDSDHAYFLGLAIEKPKGKWKFRVPSPSTIAGVGYFSAEALMSWAVKQEREGKDFREARDFAAECGTAAHNQLEALARTGKPLDLTDQPERVRGSLQAVAKWWLENRPEFICSELIVASPTYRFAGRFDALALIGGKRVMIDLKTTEKPTWQEWAAHDRARKAFAQLAGYEIALNESAPDYGPVDERAVLRVGTDGSFDFIPDPAPKESKDSFLANLNAYNGHKSWKRAAKAA